MYLTPSTQTNTEKNEGKGSNDYSTEKTNRAHPLHPNQRLHPISPAIARQMPVSQSINVDIVLYTIQPLDRLQPVF